MAGPFRKPADPPKPPTGHPAKRGKVERSRSSSSSDSSSQSSDSGSEAGEQDFPSSVRRRVDLDSYSESGSEDDFELLDDSDLDSSSSSLSDFPSKRARPDSGSDC